MPARVDVDHGVHNHPLVFGFPIAKNLNSSSSVSKDWSNSKMTAGIHKKGNVNSQYQFLRKGPTENSSPASQFFFP